MEQENELPNALESIQKAIHNIEQLLLRNLNQEKKEYYSISEAAKYLSLSESSVYKLTSEAKIAFFKPNNKVILFSKAQLEDYIKAGYRQSYPDLHANALSTLNKSRK